MPRLPIPQQYYATPSPRMATEQDFGAAQAQAQSQFAQSMMGLTETLVQVETRRRNRADTIERVRAINQFKMEADREFTRLQSESDFSSPQVVDEYQTWLTNKVTEFVGNHEGSDESKADLSVKLEAYRGDFAAQAYKQGVSEQFRLMNQHMSEATGRLADRTAEMPESIVENFAAWDQEISEMAAALTPEMEDEYRRTGRAQMLIAGVQTYLDNQNASAAEALLNMEGANEFLPPETHRQLRSRVVAVGYQADKAQHAAEIKMRQAEYILGRKLNSAERAKLAGVSTTPSNRMTLAEKVAEYESVIDRPATEAEVAKIAGADVESGTGGLGKGLTGRALDEMRALATTVESGLATADETRRFVNAMAAFRAPITRANPTTGLMETIHPALPEYALNAAAAAGLDVPGGPIGEPSVVDLDEMAIEQVTPEQTVWFRRGNIAGPVAVGAEFVGGVPGVGDLFQGGGAYTIDRNYARNIQRDLVKVLQNNPRYAEGERKAIEQEISILSGFFDTEAAFTNRLVGLDEALERREEQAFRTSVSGQVSLTERQHALNVLNGLVKFRTLLGVPVRVKNRKEALALPPGTEFITPRNEVMRVPQGGIDGE